MAGDLHAIDEWLMALAHQASPAQLRAVNRRAAIDLRRSQAARIAAQRNPDGTRYVPRSSERKSLRKKSGTIRRRTMFAKLRTQKFFKTMADAESFSVGFRGRAAVIALVHQYGDTHTSSSGQSFVTPKRELLGLTDDELDDLQDKYLNHLADFD